MPSQYANGRMAPEPPRYDVQSQPRPGVVRLESSTPLTPEQQIALSDERAKQDASKYRDLIDAIRARGREGPRPESMPFDQRTGEIVRENPYGEPALRPYTPEEARLAKQAQETQRLYGQPSAHPLTDQAASLPAYEYAYKPGFGERTDTRFTGPMAQDLQKLRSTRPAVVTDPNTGLKGVDTARLTLSNTAMISDLARLEKEKAAELEALKAKQGKGMAKGKAKPEGFDELVAALRARGKELPPPGQF